MNECTWWPDKEPENNWSGTTVGILTYITPIYYLKRHTQKRDRGGWVYLSLCKCGRERIGLAKNNIGSCGCQRSKEAKDQDPDYVMFRENVLGRPRMRKGSNKEMKNTFIPKKKKVFERGVHCIKNNSPCKHYHACQDERLDGALHSSRYRKEGCYVEPEWEAPRVQAINTTAIASFAI